MTVRIVQGDCREVLRTLPDQSVHCIVTSPPYYGLRDYGTAQWEGGDPSCEHVREKRGASTIDGGHYQSREIYPSSCGKCGARRVDRQMGLEATPDEFVAGMVAVFRECRRVLRDDGTLWLNIGDTYATSGGPGWQGKSGQRSARRFTGTRNTVGLREQSRTAFAGHKPKDLLGIPWMLAFALRADGWYLRQDIIWAKPNPMPESVRDRCTKAHEYLFLLSKSPRYYYDADAIAESAIDASRGRQVGVGGWASGPGNHSVLDHAGKNRGQSHGEAVKMAGGKGNRKTFRGGGVYTQGRSFDNDAEPCNDSIGNAPNESGTRNKRSVWYIATQPFKEAHFATFPPALVEPCILAGCPEGGTVLDPFGGAGTTGLVADRLQRDAVLIELNPEYVELEKRRIVGDAPLLQQVVA